MTVELPAGIQHGTPEGFANGCRKEKDCPATLDHGMCCLYAHLRSTTDIRYFKAKARDPRPAAIAAALGIKPPTRTDLGKQADTDQAFTERSDAYRYRPHRSTPTERPETAPDAAQPLAERANDPEPQEDTGTPVIETETPAEVTPVVEDEAMGHHPTPEETPAMPTPADAAKASKPLTTTPVDDTSSETTSAHITTDRWTAGLTQREKTEKLREIREWCRANGFPGVPTHGKIPQDALAAYAEQRQVIIVEAEVVEAVIDEELATLNREADGEPDYPEALAPGGLTPAETLTIIGRDGPERIWPLERDAGEFTEALEQTAERADLARCHTCETDNHQQCSGYVGIPIISRQCKCDCPAARFMNAAIDGKTAEEIAEAVTAGAGPVLEDLPRPEWAEVAIAVDVERARNIAVRLEQELAHVTEQLQQAHAAVETTLQKWADDTDRLQAENERLLAEVGRLTVEAGIAVGTANLWADLYAQANAETARLRLHGEQTFAQELERFLTPTPPPTPPRKRRTRISWRNN